VPHGYEGYDLGRYIRGTVAGINDPYEGDFVGTISQVIADTRNQAWTEDEINDLAAFLESLSGGRMCGSGM